MTRLLLLGHTEEDAIKAALDRARLKPITLEQVRALAVDPRGAAIRLKDRRPEHTRPPSEHVAIPSGFHLAISFEEQPAGICLHLSLSVDTPGKLPNSVAATMVFETCLKLCGIDIRKVEDEGPETWIEEFAINDRPNGLALNILYLIGPAPVGHT